MSKKRGENNIIANIDSDNNQVLDKIDELIKFIETRTGKDFKDIISILHQKEKQRKNFFPISILNTKLGVTECLVKYLKDELEWNYKKISSVIHRSEGVVGVMYRNSLKKYIGKLNIKSTDVYIPLTIFSSQFTIFESVITYLKEKENLRYSEIAKLTKRDQRTIWTIYNRTKNKKQKLEKSSLEKK